MLPAMLDDQALMQAEAQYGVIGRFQLTGRLTKGVAESSLETVQVERMHRGIYRVRGAPRVPEQRLVAASLRARPGATVTGPAVLARHQFEGFEYDAFEVLIQPGRRLRDHGFRHRIDPDPTRRVERVGQARFALPVDAFLESSPSLPVIGERAFRNAYDRLRFRFGLREHQLRRRATVLLAATPAISELLQLLEVDDLAAESEGERRIGRYLARFSPAPEAQVWIAAAHRVDWYFRDLRLAVEYQGRLDHGGHHNRERDATRERALAQLGVAVHPVTHEDLDRPDVFVQTLAGAMAVRAAKLGVATPRLR